ncbi:MAG: hypothetical protein AB7L90_07085 [Hyphomicrobiaceae bacterium]
MIKSTLAATLLLAAGMGSASAAVLPKADHSGVTAPVVEVQHRDRDHRGRDHHRHPPRWIAGRKYDRSPPGWHRHGRRPHDWRRRGCVVVGPVWFCP